jgi:hypothetical protein
MAASDNYRIAPNWWLIVISKLLLDISIHLYDILDFSS